MNRSKILRLAKLCKASYSDSPTNSADLIRTVVYGSDVATIKYDRTLKAIVVTVRGSDDKKDWRSNFRFASIDTPFGKCHRGFFKSADRLTSCIRGVIEGLPEHERVILNGHSRGGLAYIVACILSYVGFNVCAVVTFGSPKFFKTDHKSPFKKEDVIRVVNNGDRVTHVPYSWLGFRHFGTELKLKGSWWRRLPFVGLKDHDIDDYIKELGRV